MKESNNYESLESVKVISRNKSYDILRTFACILIICMHSPMPCKQANGLFLSTLSYLTAPGIGLFFMLSGSLLLPVNTDTFTFLKRRITKIIYPTIFWTLFYFVVNIIWGVEVFDLYKLFSVPFSAQGNSTLWFMYTLIGLYLLSPIISHWLRNCSKKELEFYLSLWFISLCYPILKTCLMLNLSNTGVLYYFTGYVGYYILGYYCKTYSTSLKWTWILPSTFFTLSVPIICKIFEITVDFYDLFWYLSIFVVILCIAYFKLNGFLCDKLKLTEGPFYSIVQQLSSLSFGIYLVHIFIMRYLIWEWSLIKNITSYYLQTLAVILLTYLGSALISYIISLMPSSSFIIGKEKKK